MRLKDLSLPLKQTAESLLNQVAQKAREVWQQPLQASHQLEQLSPWLSRQALSYVSGIARPYQIGMGLTVLKVTNEELEVELPPRVRNQDGTGQMHPGAVITLAEHCGQLFWSRHLDPHLSQIQLVGVEAQFLRPATEALRAQLRVSENDCEQMLFRSRQQGETTESFTVRILSAHQQLVADVELKWQIRQNLALSGSNE